jgi:hypothetical protein
MTLLTQARELLKKAKKATPGPWRSDYCGDVFTEAEKVYCEGVGGKIFRTIGSTVTGPDPGDGAYIAACSPEVVTQLAKAYLEAVDVMGGCTSVGCKLKPKSSGMHGTANMCHCLRDVDDWLAKYTIAELL